MRKVFWLAMAAVLLFPSVALAQATPTASPLATEHQADTLMPTASDLGEGWAATDFMTGVSETYGVYRNFSDFAGPNGARLRIVIFELPQPISMRAETWASLQETWQSWADYYFYPDVPKESRSTAHPVSNERFPLPDGVNDALRIRTTDAYWGLPVSWSLYAFDSGVAAFVDLWGAIQGKEQIEGGNYVASLIA